LTVQIRLSDSGELGEPSNLRKDRRVQTMAGTKRHHTEIK
jgi:hypothetical protein